jgi:hypothetical protein
MMKNTKKSKMRTIVTFVGSLKLLVLTTAKCAANASLAWTTIASSSSTVWAIKT